MHICIVVLCVPSSMSEYKKIVSRPQKQVQGKLTWWNIQNLNCSLKLDEISVLPWAYIFEVYGVGVTLQVNLR